MASYPAGPRPWDSTGAGGGIRTPDRLITNQLLYRTELRQPDKDASLARLVPRRQPTQAHPRHPIRRHVCTLGPCSRNQLIILYSGRPTPMPARSGSSTPSTTTSPGIRQGPRSTSRTCAPRSAAPACSQRSWPPSSIRRAPTASSRGGRMTACRWPRSSTPGSSTDFDGTYARPVRWRRRSGTCSTSSSRTSCTCTTC